MMVVSITIIKDPHGSDTVMLTTTLPSATWPYEGCQMIDFRAAKDQGEAYCQRHFPGIPVTVISA